MTALYVWKMTAQFLHLHQCDANATYAGLRNVHLCRFACSMTTAPLTWLIGLFLRCCSTGTAKLELTINCHLACSAGRVRVNRSHEFTELGLLERENAAILNASLRPLADQLLPSFQKAFHGRLDNLASSCCSLHSLALPLLHCVNQHAL